MTPKLLTYTVFIRHAKVYNFMIPGEFSNQTDIPDGQYRLFLKGLKIFGNPGDPNDSETYLSPVIIKSSASP